MEIACFYSLSASHSLHSFLIPTTCSILSESTYIHSIHIHSHSHTMSFSLFDSTRGVGDLYVAMLLSPDVYVYASFLMVEPHYTLFVCRAATGIRLHICTLTPSDLLDCTECSCVYVCIHSRTCLCVCVLENIVWMCCDDDVAPI